MPPRGCLPLIPHQLRPANCRWTPHIIVVTLEHTSQPHILIPQPTTVFPDLLSTHATLALPLSMVPSTVQHSWFVFSDKLKLAVK